MGSTGLSTLLFTAFSTYYINPNNKKAILKIIENENTLYYFGPLVYLEVPTLIIILSIIIFFFTFVGGLLITSEDFN